MRAGKDYAKLTGDSFYQALTLLRFGRFDEVLEVTNRPNRRRHRAALWDFAQGYAHLKQGDADFAKLYLARVQENRRDLEPAHSACHSAKSAARHRRRHSRRRNRSGRPAT